MNQTDFDIIIIGGGCAGMQLLYALVTHNNYNNQNVLVIDDGTSINQNKSWCSWIRNDHFDYAHLISKKWHALSVGTNGKTRTKLIAPYSYTYINSQTFFDFHYSYFKPLRTLQFITDHVINVVESAGNVTVRTEKSEFTCSKVYNSQYTRTDIAQKSSTYIHQQFHGLFIETENNVFNTETAVLMDFIGSQDHAVTFMYVLPFTPNKALVEITRFTVTLDINQESDESVLHDYIHSQYKTKFRILNKEAGVLPMTDYRFSNNYSQNIIPIGIAAGMMKPSTGYAFNRIYRHSKQLSNNYYSKIDSANNKERFFFYDKLLLKLIEINPRKASEVLQCLFKRVPISKILQFLDEDSSIKDEMALFLRLPKSDFIRLIPSINY
jgi:lycopene beta-cyclase